MKTLFSLSAVVLVAVLLSGLSSVYAAPIQEKRAGYQKRQEKRSQEVAPESQIRILLPESTVVDGETYKLSEVSQIQGEDFDLIEKLNEVEIGRSPLPGHNTVLSESLVTSRIRPLVDRNKIVFPGATSTRIERSALKISGSDIEQAVSRHIQSQNPNEEIKTKFISSIQDVLVPKGELTYEVGTKREYKKEGGYRTYDMVFYIDGKIVKTVPVRVYVKVYKDIVVAKETIHRNEVIEESDLTTVKRNVDRLPATYVEDKNHLIGKIAKRVIGPEEILKENSVTTAPIVNSGDRLLIVFDTPTIRLTAPGIAMSKGRMGDRIPVRNIDSKTIVFAKVSNKNVVEVQ
ncbi:MAG: flagellar basal body P-ring formation protein FlgA [SAR324 cluster bacterium]|nr:flagellar basal body P-ring formation protein FlgA [SAR324 cluster bacterium]